MEIPQHPFSGALTDNFFTNDDGTVKVTGMFLENSTTEDVKRDMAEYIWNDDDFLLASFPKNGTHFLWEIMTMLLRGSADYITDPKEACMIEMFPLKETASIFPSPRVLNTHYRLDVLPKEFRGRKTVLAIRNPKDTSVSYYYHEKKIMSISPLMKDFLAERTYSQCMKMFLYGKDQPFGNYFDYLEYMWSLKDDPNVLVVFYEDLIVDPLSNIQKVNEFMGTGRSLELMEKIVLATKFDNMKKGKAANYAIKPELQKQFQQAWLTEEKRDDSDVKKPTFAAVQTHMYRKGKIGDWKNHLTVAENEMFDEFLERWPLSREIPFKY